MTNWLQSLQMHEILIYGLVLGLPIVVIGFAFVEMTIKAIIKHRERITMLEQGIDPDYYDEQPEEEDLPDPRPGNMDETQPYSPRRG